MNKSYSTKRNTCPSRRAGLLAAIITRNDTKHTQTLSHARAIAHTHTHSNSEQIDLLSESAKWLRTGIHALKITHTHTMRTHSGTHENTTHLLLADARSPQAGLAVDDDVVVLEGDVARRRRPKRPRVVRIGGRLQCQVAEQHEARFARLQKHTHIHTKFTYNYNMDIRTVPCKMAIAGQSHREST